MACWRLRFHDVAYGRRKLGSTPVIGHGLLFGAVLSGESQRIWPALGNTGPAILQFRPEVNCTLAVLIFPGPCTPFKRAPVGIAFTPRAGTPCCDTNTLKPSTT